MNQLAFRNAPLIALLLVACEAPTDLLGVGSAEIEVFSRDRDSNWQPLLDGGTLPVLLGPAGGVISHISVGVQNLSASDLSVEVSVLAPAREEAIFTLRREMSAGDAIPLIVCPTRDGIDVAGVPHTLFVTASDASDRSASKTLSVVPSCVEPEYAELCSCWCSSRYPDCD